LNRKNNLVVVEENSRGRRWIRRRAVFPGMEVLRTIGMRRGDV